MRFQLSLILVLISWSWAVAVGQDSAAVHNNRQAAIQALHLGRRIRVATPAGEFQGAFTGADAARLWITRDNAVTAVGLADIDGLWVRSRATKTGALVGALAGAVIGAGYGLFIGEVVCNNSDCRANTAEVVVVLGLGGAGAGGLAGTIIGLAIPRWHQRFP